MIAAIFTTLYSFRLLYLAFHGVSVSSPTLSYHPSGFFINVAVFVLAFCAIFIGFVFQDYFINFNNSMELRYFFADDTVPFFIKFWLLFIAYLNLQLTISYKFNRYLFSTLY